MDQYKISVNRACRCMELVHSMFYYRRIPREDGLPRLRVRDIAQTWIRYGFDRIHVLLRREGFVDNHKRVYRIYREEGLNLRMKRPRRNRSSAHRLERLGKNKINQVWSTDFL